MRPAGGSRRSCPAAKRRHAPTSSSTRAVPLPTPIGRSTRSWVESSSGLDFGRILCRSDPFLDERVPVVAVRALPQQLRAAVTAAHADVRVQIEDRVPCEVAVTIDETGRVVQLAERPPDRLVDTQRVRILHERGEQEIERLAWLVRRGEMLGQCEPRAPVLRALVDQPPAQTREPIGVSGTAGERLEAVERQVRAIWCDVDEFLPDSGSLAFVPFGDA